MIRRLLGRRHGVTLFLSTGRCGTQWLAASLAAVYDDLALVQHEPIGTAYNSSTLLRDPDQDAVLARNPDVTAHLDRVREALQERDYIETGAPLYGAVPHLLRAFPGRVRLVHVVRHPVTTATSIATHDHFSRTGADRAWHDAAILDPRRDRVVQRDLAERWETMSNFEKSLFFWTEVNLYAGELRREYPRVPFLRTRFEDLVNPESDALPGLVDFLGLPARPGMREAPGRVVDRWRMTVDDLPAWRRTAEYPAAVALAQEYGYSLDAVDEEALRARYVEVRPGAAST